MTQTKSREVGRTTYRIYRFRALESGMVIVESLVNGDHAGSVYTNGREYDEGKMPEDVRVEARAFLNAMRNLMK